MIEVIDKGGKLFLIKIVVRQVYTQDIPNLKELLLEAISDYGIKKLVIDLSDVYMITSSGLGVFYYVNKSLESQLRLASVNPEVKKVLEMTKIISIVTICSTVDEAIASFN
ncbi:MAG: STAS domain-containing protein [Spirochaetes bacterium]|nr:STAS domain-containing protein [Spirochaetota bacterium]